MGATDRARGAARMLCTTACYDKLSDYRKANRVELAAAEAQAIRQAEQFIAGLPPGADADAFRSRALDAAWRAALAYRPERRVPFASWTEIRVRYALKDEARKQDLLSEPRRRALRGDAAGPRPFELPPLSLDASIAEAAEAHLPWDPAPPLGPEDQAVELELAAQLRDALSRLPARDREVLYLRFWEGWTYAEIGRHLGVVTSRAAEIVEAARHHLHQLLLAAGFDPSAP
jgi:RNA polymerase sigma factor (sigma-70 family)